MNLEKYDELSKLLQFDEEYESKIFLPNEIFSDLANSNEFKTANHRAFAFSYIYLTTWLYRYCKYSNSTEIINQRKLKEILGYSPDDKRTNYLIKKNGLLEQLDYLKTTTNFPISWEFEGTAYDDNDNLLPIEFEMYHDLKEYDPYLYGVLNMGKNFNIKYPVKAFHRNGNENELDGTFYNFERTFLIPFEVFLYCMSNEEVGTVGFYLYSYIKMNNQKFDEGYNISYVKLANNLKLTETTTKKYMAVLKKYKMVKFYHRQEFFVYGLEKSKRRSNSYYANEAELFTGKPISYDKIKVLSMEEYDKILEERGEKIEQSKVDIPLDMLPF